MTLPPLKILLVEDNEDDYLIVRDMLALVSSVHFEVVWVNTYEAALLWFTQSQSPVSTVKGHYDACLLDYHLGEFNGLDLLQQAIAQGYQPPIILLTGLGNPDIDQQALDLGAAGFLAKDEISPATLERTIRYAIRHNQTEAALHQTQGELVQTNATLATQVAAQAVELEQVRAREAYFHQLQTRLLAAVSHEFRTPLMHIQGSADLLEEMPGDAATQARRFELIHQGVERITKTLDNALIYAALAAGSTAFKPVPLNLVALCEELVTNLQPGVVNQQQLQFINHQFPTTPIYVDISLVQLMLTHLLLNAIRYAPESDRIQLELSGQALGPGSGSIIFRVRDTGIGIPAAELDNVWDAYYRASNADQIAGTPGVGLGLAIVKRAVDLHGGSIKLTSAVGVGTTVTLALPWQTSA